MRILFPIRPREEKGEGYHQEIFEALPRLFFSRRKRADESSFCSRLGERVGASTTSVRKRPSATDRNDGKEENAFYSMRKTRARVH